MLIIDYIILIIVIVYLSIFILIIYNININIINIYLISTNINTMIMKENNNIHNIPTVGKVSAPLDVEQLVMTEARSLPYYWPKFGSAMVSAYFSITYELRSVCGLKF